MFLFAEMDEMIAEQQKMAISDIFAQYGETHFRDLETQLVKDISEKDGVIVSCGGGAVLREENVIFYERKWQNRSDYLLHRKPFMRESATARTARF